MKTGRASHMVNGVSPTHALPSNVSMDNLSGMRRRSASAGVGQCINRSLPQDWYMIGEFAGRSRIDNRSATLGNRSLIACCRQPWRQHTSIRSQGGAALYGPVALRDAVLTSFACRCKVELFACAPGNWPGSKILRATPACVAPTAPAFAAGQLSGNEPDTESGAQEAPRAPRH
jgi:hypothetical protein